ncbi:putative lysine N-acyltransferase [Streptomyces sp. NBRC 110611]|uniref:GNAT family N-acetyltransferase n=1 Tax=Streptomyces sp. NBRC 110611 TaxID=1621259 RepID=UPI00085904AA|nr:GNAT family N-acetyltransferase [Streptomyces sp. NBRC 110611]GAU67079.1 putative lysine N-acyltransferase [Streptomyces sp. NBRC 110611]
MTSLPSTPPDADEPDEPREPDGGGTVPGPPLPLLGAPWSVRVARAEGDDIDLVHGWMRSPHIDAFWHQAWPRERWAEELAGHLSGDTVLPCLVHLAGRPLAYIEVYRVLRDRIAGHYPYHPHDLGVHIAIGEPSDTGKGLGRSLLRALAEGLLAADPACVRVVAEPDVDNAPSLRAFSAAAFRLAGKITFPEKTAALLIHPRSEKDLPQ